jgi:hypothetical protein
VKYIEGERKRLIKSSVDLEAGVAEAASDS